MTLQILALVAIYWQSTDCHANNMTTAVLDQNCLHGLHSVV